MNIITILNILIGIMIIIAIGTTFDVKYKYIIALALVSLFISINNTSEHFDNEAIQNIASVYNSQNMTVDNLIVKNALSVGGATTLNTLSVNGGGEFNGGRYYFNDQEKCGRLRVGCAWGRPGIYAEDNKQLSIGSSNGETLISNSTNVEGGNLRSGYLRSAGWMDAMGGIRNNKWLMRQGNSGRLVINRDDKNRAVAVDPDGSFYSAWFKDYNEGDYNDNLYKEARDGLF